MEKITIKEYAFNPFRYIAGGKALALGMLAILAGGVLSYFSNLHFDGVLDIHLGKTSPLFIYLTEGFIDWLAISLVLLLSGAIIPHSRSRAIDIFGTQALARAPMFIVAIVSFLIPTKHVTAWMEGFFVLGAPKFADPSGFEWFAFGVLSLIMILCTIWMITLMFRGYKISTNLKGSRVVISFIIGLIIAEILSKLALNFIFKQINI